MRRRIAPGSLEDRVLEVLPLPPVEMRDLVTAGKARKEDVIACVQRLIADGQVRRLGDRRGARYVRVG